MSARTDTRRGWVTLQMAAEVTGLPESFLQERTAGGAWPEGKLWKWWEGRKVIDLDALYSHIDSRPSEPSNRGRRKVSNDSCHQEKQAA